MQWEQQSGRWTVVSPRCWGLWRLTADLVHTNAILSHQRSERSGFAPPWDLIPGTTSKQTHPRELLLFQSHGLSHKHTGALNWLLRVCLCIGKNCTYRIKQYVNEWMKHKSNKKTYLVLIWMTGIASMDACGCVIYLIHTHTRALHVCSLYAQC